jgi:hypothetical protein
VGLRRDFVHLPYAPQLPRALPGTLAAGEQVILVCCDGRALLLSPGGPVGMGMQESMCMLILYGVEGGCARCRWVGSRAFV